MDDEVYLFRGWPVLTEKVSFVVGLPKYLPPLLGMRNTEW